MTIYDIGYLDGRNHALSLITRFVQSKECTPEILSDRTALEDALQRFDPGFFNNYDTNIGPIY
mgnify:FL=1